MSIYEQSEERLSALADGLLLRTKRGEVQWEATDDENSFLLTTKQGGVIIRVAPMGTHRYTLEVLDAAGRVVDQLYSREPEGYVASVERAETLQELWELARRAALGADGIVDSIFDDLGIEKPNQG